MAVQQLGPEASRAGARRARALAARAGGPTAALVALSTVTVTSLVAIAFAPLPHAVSPGIGGGVAAPSDVRPLTTPTKTVHSPGDPTVKKTKTTGSSFTSTPPAAGGTTSGTSGRTGGGTTTHHGGSGSGSGGAHKPPVTKPDPGNGGSGTTGGTHGGTGTEGTGNGGTICVTPEHPDDESASTTSPICFVLPHGWHSGGGSHIIVVPPIPPITPGTPNGDGDGDSTSGSGSGTLPGGGQHGTNPGSTTPPTQGPVDPSGSDSDAGSGAGTHSGTGAGSTGGTGGTGTTSGTTTIPTAPAVTKPAAEVAPVVKDGTKADVKDADDSSSHNANGIGKHRVYGEHRAGGKHRG